MVNLDPDISPYYQLPLLGFDTETDGVDVKNNHIITCNITYSMLDASFMKNDWLIKPQAPIPQGASDVHGITTEYAETYGMEPREALQGIHDHLAAWQDHRLPIVAYNAAYDCSILTYEWARHGIDSQVRFDRVIDPFVLDRVAFPYRKGTGARKLGKIAEFYGVELENAHAADADVEAVLWIARLMPRFFPRETLDLMVDVDTLHARQVEWKSQQAAELQKYFRGKGGKPEAIVNGEWPVIYGETGN